MKKKLKRTLSFIMCFIMIAGTFVVGGMAAKFLTVAKAEADVDWGRSTTGGVTTAKPQYNVGDIIEFGSYPQSEVKDSATLAKLTAAAKSWVSYGYYSGDGNYGSMKPGNWMEYADITLDGEKYRAVRLTQLRPNLTIFASSSENTFQDDNGYDINTVYYFIYEPLKWRILDLDEGLVLSELSLDAQAFSNLVYLHGTDPYGINGTDAMWNSAEHTNYSVDYKTSSIRKWLNGEFNNTAFTSTQQNKILTTKLDNSAYSDNYNKLDGKETQDKLFLPSFRDVTNSRYGFKDSSQTYDTARSCKCTDYAKIQGTFVDNSGASNWLLRTASTHSGLVVNIDSNGRLGRAETYATFIGIRPALRLSNIIAPSTYSLSYSANGGSGAPSTQSGSTSYTISSTVPTRSGYTFLGWSKSSSATAPEYYAGNTITLSGNTTLYAVWVKNDYFLTKNDIFSFTNSDWYFRSGTYTITNADFNKLSNYVKKIYSPANARTYINRMQELRNSQWVGSCYGMAVASILNKKGQIAFPKNFDPKASSLYDVDAPYQNSAVQSAVNYYFLSQKIPVMRGDSYFNSNANWSAGLKKLVSSVKSGKLTLFCYYWKEVSNGKEEIKGHAIALVGYEEASGGGYNLIAYDNRYGENYITVYVDKNYSSCVVNGVEKPYGIEFLTDFSDFDKIDIDGPNNDMVLNTRSYNQSANTQISVELNGEVTVENKAGQKLTVKNGNISGDMDVVSTHMIVKSTPDGSPAPVTLVFEVNDSSAFAFESSSNEINASVTNDKCYASVTATADTVVISENEGIYAIGDNVNFSGSLSLNNEVCDMMSFVGSGNGDINLVYADDGVIVNGASGKGTVTVYSDTTSINTAKFNSDYSNIKISGDGTGIAGNVEIAASSDNSGVYDVKIANMQNSKFEFAEKNVSMYYKATKNLAVSSSDKVIYTSSDPDIVSVDSSGNIIALKTGNVTITATNTDTGDVDSCTVNVSYAWWQVLIRILLLGFLWY